MEKLFNNSELHIAMKNQNEQERITNLYEATKKALENKPDSKFWQEAYEFIKAKAKGESKE